MKKLAGRYRQDIFSLVLVAGALFVASALATYDPRDPSFNTVVRQGSTTNACGIFGAHLADLLYQVFGLAAWLWVAFLVFLAFGWKRRWQLTWVVGLVAAAGSLGMVLGGSLRFFGGQISLGGIVGLWLGHLLLAGLNDWGTVLLLVTFMLIALLALTGFSLQPSRWRPTDFFGRLAKWVTLWLAQRRSRRAVRSAATPVMTASAPKKSSKSFPIRQTDSRESRRPSPPAQDKREPRRGPGVEGWRMPGLTVLKDPPTNGKTNDEKEIREQGLRLIRKLEQFGVRGQVVGAKPGPAVTLFEFKPNVDVKISKITELADDLALALSSESVRIIAPIPGRDVVGIETANVIRDTVYLKGLMQVDDFWDERIKLPIALGAEADGTKKIVDLRRMPHLLVAGSTGSGKSVFVVSLLVGLLFRHSPKTLRLILIDPKQVDLAAFQKIPHLLMPPIQEAKKAISALRWAIKEMDKRYRSMAKFGARGLEEFNEVVGRLSSEQRAEHQARHAETSGSPQASYYFTELPYIVIVVEEFADLMVVDKGNVEQAVVRLAQMARACGMHLILAMQSPRKDVVTGLIKTNIPGRVSFKVASKMDSRIILDESGAERLLSRGDMLFLAPGVAKPQRHHGPWISDEEIGWLTQFWRDQGEPEYDPLLMKALSGGGDGSLAENFLDGPSESDGDGHDEMYDEVLAWVASQKAVSASLLQRRFRLGYPRAARLIEIFESEGVIGAPNGSKPRQVLVNDLSK